MTRPLFMSLLIFTLFSVGCAAKFRIPGGRFMTPESSGQFAKGDIKAGMSGTVDVEVADNITSSSPDTTPLLHENSDPALALQVGLMERVDLYYTAVLGSAEFAGAKLQIIGDSAANSKSGNFSLALAGGASFGSQDLTSSTNSVEGEANLDFSGWEAMLLIGYRPTDSTVVYLGPSVINLQSDVTIQRTSGGTTSITAQPHGEGEVVATTLGLRTGQSIFLSLEATFFKANWKRTNPTVLEAEEYSDTLLSAAVGGAW